MAPGRTFVVVGANLAGGRAVETLRAEGFDGRIVLVGAEPHRPYERPPLSKEILRGEWELEKAYLRPEAWYAENEIKLRLGVRASSLDAAGRTVTLADGDDLPYDALLLATGGVPRTLPIPGSDAEGVFLLRTIDDSLALRERLTPGAPLVVVGAGFIGCEVAASARMLGCDVTVIEVFDVPLLRALGKEVGGIWGEVLRERSIDLRTGTGVERIDAGTEGLRVVTAEGPAIDAAAVVVGVGIAPAVELAERAGIRTDDGVIVDERCETSVPGVYAAGDVARHPNPILGERIRVEHWQNAQNQGTHAAKCMLGSEEPFTEVPWFWSDQFDLNLQMSGHPSRWDRIVWRGDIAARTFAAFYLDSGRVVAAVGVNRGKDVRAARGLIGKAAPPDVLADEGTDLRALAKA